MKRTKINIAVLVSGGGTNLQALINAQSTGILKSGEIKLVISNKADAYALQRAAAAGIETAVVSKKELGADGMEKAISELLSRRKIDLIVLAGFMCILSAGFTAKYDHRIINVHPSLIPSFCGEGYYGLRVHKAALEKGVKVTGATVHFVNEIPDGGEIILQKAVTVPKNATPESLQNRVMRLAEWKILPRACEITAKNILKEENDNERV